MLGTYVHVALEGADEGECAKAADLAFEAIARVGAAMSFHDPASELSRLNRHPVGEWMPASVPLRQVLGLALDLQARSGSAFNAAIGHVLVSWGLLPGTAEETAGGPLDVPGFELREREVRRRLPVQIDLGGMAKGYAVDRAIEAIRHKAERLSGCVNAGGDLRVFGAAAQWVGVRSGPPHATMMRVVPLSNEALATSSVHPEGARSPYVDTRRGQPYLAQRTAVARAPRCVVADALTKVALLVPDLKAAQRIAAHYGAEVSLLP